MKRMNPPGGMPASPVYDEAAGLIHTWNDGACPHLNASTDFAMEERFSGDTCSRWHFTSDD